MKMDNYFIKKYILILLLSCTGLSFFLSCNEDDLDSESIFAEIDDTLDPNSYSFLLDRWLYDNYLMSYNLQFRYRLEDVGADLNYNLVPAKYDKAIDIAVLTKYLWFDVYGSRVRRDFLKEYGPRIIHLIGSPAYNPANGTMILGLAEGGLKVSLFRCNLLDYENVDVMNELYFKTMHHEFAHILHQTKTYPKEYNLISSAYYQPFSWQDRPFEIAASLGFVSSYAGSEKQEDFVEIIANYIVKTEKDWNEILDIASKGWQPKLDTNGNLMRIVNRYGIEAVVCEEIPDTDGVDGKAIILQKLSICKQWLNDAWNVNLDSLRKEVIYRQEHINIDSLRNQLILDYPEVITQ
jgi:substrate import-associated zinc metallohydrolase lipoprotein